MSCQRIVLFLFMLGGFIPLPLQGYAAAFEDVAVEVVEVAEHIYMLQGQGGNIGLCVGEDGVFMIDDQFAPLTEKIRAAIGKISDREIRFLINTHYHNDHVGGNENIGKGGAVIVAHANVRERMASAQVIEFFNRRIPAYGKDGLPVITFASEINLHLNHEDIRVFHVRQAHTDGDAVIYFEKANVIHTGDIYFAGIYPFIDTSVHGSVTGMIEGASRILDMIDEKTKVIPGHGPLSNKGELARYVAMLRTITQRVASEIATGKTLIEVQQRAPSREFDTEWGNGFLSPDKFIRILYEDLSRLNQ